MHLFVQYIVQCSICVRFVIPVAQHDTPSQRSRNLPCTEIGNREYSSGAFVSQRVTCSADGIKGVDSVEVQKKGRQHARRSLHYDNNENIIDETTTGYVLSRKRPISPESLSNGRPRKRCRTEVEPCMLESLEVKPLQTDGTESECILTQNLATVTISRKSGQWKMSTPTRKQTLTPRKDATTQLDTPSKSVTFHDSVVGGDNDEVSQSPKRTPKSGRRTPKTSLTPNRQPHADGTLTPRARRSICLTPKSSQKGTPGKSDDAVGSPAGTTPRRSSARVANVICQVDSSPRRKNKATPRTSDKKKDLPARKQLVTSLPGTGRVLRPRTPKSYKFTAAGDHDDDFYLPLAESSDEEETDVKRTPTRKQVHNFYEVLLVFYICCSQAHYFGLCLGCIECIKCVLLWLMILAPVSLSVASLCKHS